MFTEFGCSEIEEKWDILVANFPSKRRVGFEKAFFKMTGDITASIMLNEIFSLYTQAVNPYRNMDRADVKIVRNGYLWIARSRSDWEEVCITYNQYDYKITILKKQGYIDTMTAMHNKTKKVLIRLTEKFVEDYYAASMDEEELSVRNTQSDKH